MKKFLVYSIGLLLLAGCKPTVDAKYWESELKPDMAAHKTYLMASEQVCASYIQEGGNPKDKLRERHMADALKYINTYIADSLDSYKEVAHLHDCLAAKDAKDELSVDNYEEVKEEDVKATIATLFLGALLGLTDTSNIEQQPNYTKEYVLEIADLLQQQFNSINLVLDSPEFQHKTEDCITYSVYCPTNDEHYTLTYAIATKEYSWDVGDNR